MTPAPSAGRTQSWRYNLREFKALTHAQKKAVLEKYGNACGACGYHCGLEVHHIEGEAMEASKEKYNAPDNLIALCSKCHTAFTALELHHVWLYRTMAMPYLKKLLKP